MQSKKKLTRSVISATEKRRNDVDFWKVPLETMSINDEYWWCMVVMMIESTNNYTKYVSLFNEAAEEGKRSAIYLLSSQKVLGAVKSLSKQNLENCPPMQGICHYSYKLLSENNGTLPTWLMAYVVKYLIYRAKIEHISRLKKQAELQHEIDEEYRIMQNVADTAAFTARRKQVVDEKSRGKAVTRLRKRDEEWRDIVYMEDAPVNGPNLYIILTGFHDANLPSNLIDVGVPLTCILRIKSSNEVLEYDVVNETTPEVISSDAEAQFSEDFHNQDFHLYEFWKTIEEYMNNPVAYPLYCDIAFLTFQPLEISKCLDDTQRENLKKDTYDRVSYLVYDLYDLYRQHATYLGSMKLERKIIADIDRKCDMDVYEIILNAVPQEYASVPVILGAMILQIEINDAKCSADQFSSQHDDVTEIKTDTDVDEKHTSENPIALVQQKLKFLDTKYELENIECTSNNKLSDDTSKPELILHGDTLDLIARFFHADDNIKKVPLPNVADLIDRISRILWHPMIMGLWRNHEKLAERKLKKYADHFDKIRRYFETNVEISVEEVRHYLHVCMFDKVIFNGLLSRKNRLTKCVKEKEMEINRSSRSRKKESLYEEKESNSKTISDTSFLTIPKKLSKSAPTLAMKATVQIHRKSDTDIDYGKSTPELDDSSPLFDLMEPRELLLPGYSKRDASRKKHSATQLLDEYENVELLSRRVFLQTVYECFLSYDRYDARYFEPTDSILLYFANSLQELDDVHVEETVASLRTPVGLREFCEYIVAEERDWIEREEETYLGIVQALQDSTERLMKKKIEVEYDETMIFGDEHFILPYSLKARDREGTYDFPKRKNDGYDINVIEEKRDKDTARKKERKEEIKVTKKGNKGKVEKMLSERTSLKEKKRTAQTDDVDMSFLPKRKILSTRCAEEGEPYEFIGYDLGKLRIQVTNRKKTFRSSDGTFVHVELDEWLYEKRHLRITVTMKDLSLKLFPEIETPGINEIFHLETKKGIILAFCKFPNIHEEFTSSSWRDTRFDFRGSWPSGLLIEPIIGDGAENPFYIRQSYTSRSHGSNRTIREVCRKFLRNGTVLKYFDDNSIIVLRPNGAIVTCTAFDEPKRQENEIPTSQTNVTTESMRMKSKNKKKPTNSVKSKLREIVEENNEVNQLDSSRNSVSSISDVSGVLKVSRYTVLNHDGRQYEVLDDQVVSEHHRLLVRTESNYEVNEKFTRRADGTDMLLNSNGELIVNFPDGTRITTAYKIEEEPATCEWSEEEIQRYFVFERMGGNEEHNGMSFSSTKSLEENSSRSNIRHNNEITKILIADGFVSVLLTCRMEHKNYATVFYDQSAVNCTLSMPDDLRVSISRRGHYEVSMGSEVNLKITEERLIFSDNVCSTCGGQSTSTYNFGATFKGTSRTIFTSIDVFGNVFEVKDDGTTCYRKKNEPTDQRRFDSCANISDEEDSSERKSEEIDIERMDTENVVENFMEEHHHDHERYRDIHARGRYRIFAMNRNLTAYEYLHRSVRHELEAAAVSDNVTSMILYPISRRPELPRLITFKPVEHESRSKMSLQPIYSGNVGALRSTYSIPYDWLFPFGKNGNGIWRNSHDIPLIKSIVPVVPKLLEVRILYGFKVPGGSTVIDLQRALGRYWMSLASCSTKRRSNSIVRSTVETREVPTDFVNFENDLQDLASGMKRYIDRTTDITNGLQQGRFNTSSAKTPDESNDEFAELLTRRASITREEFEWYKHCMRKKIIVPYFQNVAGICFLWIRDCVEEALKLSTINQSSSPTTTIPIHDTLR